MKIMDFIIADDIRRETGSKFSIMGIYNESINLTVPPEIEWPIPFKLAIYIRFDNENLEVMPDCVKLQILHNRNIIAQIEGSAPQKGGSRFSVLPIVANVLPLPGPGALEFELQVISNNETIFTGQSPFPIEILVNS